VKFNVISVFDLDETLLVNNSSYQFFKFLIDRKAISRFSICSAALFFFRHHYLKMPLSDLHHKIFDRFLCGFPLHQLYSYLNDFIFSYVPSSLYVPVFNFLRQAQHLGHYTMVLSSSPDFLVKQIADFLGVDEWKASEYSVDNKQMLSHVSSVMDGEMKAKHVLATAQKLNVSNENIIAFTDSFLDLPLLLAAGRRFCVKPDRKLHRFSLEQGWTII
jgi:HAD superfamily phosphoserine phosphatase-like hydrolase